MTPDPGSWRLAPPHAANTQGLIVSPYAHLPEALVLLLDATAAPGSAWLHALLNGDGALAITPATGKSVEDDGSPAGCAAIAVTATGLQMLGLPADVLTSFALPFQEGMHEPHRRRRLGDIYLDPPGRHRRPLWGGNMPLPADTAADVDAIVADRTVHAAVLLYHETTDQLAAYAAPVRARLGAAGIKIVHELDLSLNFDVGKTPPVAREHFGFADGISQPSPFNKNPKDLAVVTKAGEGYPQDPLHGVAAGDVVIGLINAHDEPAPGPLLPADAPGADALTAAPGDPAHLSLGLDGSYFVMRELSQDPDAFWASMTEAAANVGKTADWVAERVIGRTKDGVILAKTPPGPTADGPGNDFTFYADDSDGMFCPLGSHVRRSNPRDGLAPDKGDCATLLHAANNHRILRRGRKYASYQVPDTPALPGLLFMCLNTDLERQFEFVQQTWLLNPSFATLFHERDPLLGPAGPFTIPAEPLRLRTEVDTFVSFVGGEYFFMPSLAALSYLASMSAPEHPAP